MKYKASANYYEILDGSSEPILRNIPSRLIEDVTRVLNKAFEQGFHTGVWAAIEAAKGAKIE